MTDQSEKVRLAVDRLFLQSTPAGRATPLGVAGEENTGERGRERCLCDPIVREALAAWGFLQLGAIEA